MLLWKSYSDRVLVKVDAKPTQTAGGIVLPSRMKGDKIGTGEIIAVGPLANGVQVGDRVSYQVNGAHEVEEGVVSLNVDYLLGGQRSYPDDV